MSDIEISTNPERAGNANLIYILYLVGIALGITAIVGLIMAYVSRPKAPAWLQSHYDNQINIFWKGLLYMIAGAVLLAVVVGALVLLAALVWYIVRIVKGMQTLSRGEPEPDPARWGF